MILLRSRLQIADRSLHCVINTDQGAEMNETFVVRDVPISAVWVFTEEFHGTEALPTHVGRRGNLQAR